jgi:serine protease Do
MRLPRQGLRALLGALVTTLCVLPPLGLAQSDAPPPPSNARAMVDAAIDRMRPALVRIHVVSTDYQEGREVKVQAVGSGAIISQDGYVITNHHVAGHGARMVCTLSDREEIPAELVGSDPLTDIAVLKLKPARPQPFIPAAFGDSSKIRVGDSVLAMGSPMALSQSVTMGIVSNTEMIMPKWYGPSERFHLDGEDVGALVRWIGHDAQIYEGNSGGPLVDLKGEIIGVNEIRFGLSGAIPSNLAREVSRELIAHGRVQRSWLGVDVQPLFKHDEGQHGILIGGVIADSPASRAGLRSGDRLLRLAGSPCDVRYEEQMPDFMRLVTNLPLGREVEASVSRDGRTFTVSLRPAERGEFNSRQQELKQWGLTVRDLSFLTAREMKRPDQRGVLVTSVRPGGPSGDSKPALEAQDVIVEVAGQPIQDAADLIAATRRLTDGRSEPTPLMTTFERGARRLLAVVKVGTQELSDPGLEVAKAWLPVETHVISRDIAAQLGQPALKGFYITRVYPGTTAERAGLKPGDYITAADGESLSAAGPEDEEELADLVRQRDIGAKMTLDVRRRQERLRIPVELARTPKLKREMKKYRNDDFEFTARDISFFDIAEEQWPTDQRGAWVEEVKPGSWAEVGSLRSGDLIIEVDGRRVDDVAALKPLMVRISQERRPSVRMKVVHGIHSSYLELEPEWSK